MYCISDNIQITSYLALLSIIYAVTFLPRFHPSALYGQDCIPIITALCMKINMRIANFSFYGRIESLIFVYSFTIL